MTQKNNKTAATPLSWTKWSFCITRDERIEALIQNDGVRALGAWVYIVNEMLQRKKHRMTMYQIRHLHLNGFKHPEKLVENSDLFLVSEDGFVTPVVGFSTTEATTAAGDDAKALCMRTYRGDKSIKNSYRYEDAGSCAGRRSYHGIPLPDDAPARPDEACDWDFENKCWVSAKNL